jgi:threonine dehydrogenase-like Zn-dependent dehydrogenase
MRAAIVHERRRIEVGERPDPSLREPTDAVVRVVLACVCGSDLRYYRGDSEFAPGPIGHEFIGVMRGLPQPQRFELVSSTVYTDGSTVQVLRPAGHDR